MSSTQKRKCPSPEEEVVVPMADGVVMQGYLRESKRIAAKYHGQKRKIQEEASCMLEGVGEYFLENVCSGGDGDFKSGIQMVNSLLEVAASIATLVQTDDDEERRKLGVLYEHAIGGLRLIGAEEAEKWGNEDE
jgi:hypothetical protein